MIAPTIEESSRIESALAVRFERHGSRDANLST
jgi:hypothetical protein